MGTATREEKLRTRQNPEASGPEGKGREQEGAKGLPSSTQRSTVSTLLQTEGAALHAALLMLSWVPRAAQHTEPSNAHL